MAENYKDKLTYQLKKQYVEGWEYDEKAQNRKRMDEVAFSSIAETYLPSTEKAKILYFKAKYSTNIHFRHLFESFEVIARQFLKWRNERDQSNGLNQLVEGKDTEVLKRIHISKQKELKNIIEQIAERKSEIMSTEDNIPKEYGEDIEMNDFMDFKVSEETVLLSDSDKNDDEDYSNTEEEKVGASELIIEETKSTPTPHNLDEYMIPTRKPVEKKDSPLKAILEKHFSPNRKNLSIIYHVMELIISKITKEEIQDELINLLGYDKIEMIQQIYQYRFDMVKDIKWAMNSMRYDRKRPSEADIISLLLFLDVKMPDIQAKPTYNLKDFMYDEIVETTTLRTDQIERTTDKNYSVAKYKALEKHEHKEIKRIPLTAFPPWTHKCFSDISELNAIQSNVYETAYLTSENMLVCAPTGAGKTNIALMAVLREIELQNPEEDLSRKKFTIVYSTPMKALAGEIVTKFSKMLAHLKLRVRELTGDMQLSRTEIEETHMLVVTPEKLDVVTRKNDALLMQTKLLILDEIHLLDEDRGAVLECLVIRVMNYIQRKQTPLRVVGLSATLPNYKDVGEFLHASKGAFFFDSTYRPTPLSYEFCGIKESLNQMQQKVLATQYCYDKIKEVIRNKKQVLVFVHSRGETASLGNDLIELMQYDKSENRALFLENKAKNAFRSEVSRSPNLNLQKLFEFSIGMHNAGMLRKDRNLSEKLFLAGATKVLISTATLAWGVNLPAYCVIIKGTQYYDPATSKYVDVGILDIQQIFGRAGRPQFDSEGEAVIITSQDKMANFIGMLMNQTPIESHLQKMIDDAINAEISNGSIISIDEAVKWLKQSFLEQRLSKNPHFYSTKPAEIAEDPEHIELYKFIASQAARKLKKEGLIEYNPGSSSTLPRDLGKIAANFYLRHGTAAKFKKELEKVVDSQSLLTLLANAEEFENLTPRKDEIPELKRIHERAIISDIDVCETMEPYAKVILLLEAYLFQQQITVFSLIADMNYVMQNIIRLMRGLVEIALKEKNFQSMSLCLQWAVRLEKRMVEGQSFVRQFSFSSNVSPMNYQRVNNSLGFLRDDIIRIIEENNIKIEDFFEEDRVFLKRTLGSPYYFDRLMDYINHFPRISIYVEAQPITRTILRINLKIVPKFKWSDRWNKAAENYWILVVNDGNIHYSQQFSILKKDYVSRKNNEFNVTFYVPFPAVIYPGSTYDFHVINEYWLEAEDFASINLSDIELPIENYKHTKLEKRSLRPLSDLKNEKFQKLYSGFMKEFNKVQTHVFEKLYLTDENILIGAPTGSGKTIIGELAMLRTFSQYPGEKVVYIAPLKALTKERLKDWRQRLPSIIGKSVVELTGDFTPDMRALINADLLITTPEKWDGITRHWAHRDYVKKVGLLIIDEIHLLGQERGPVLEVIVCRMRAISTKIRKNIRIVGLSTALANAIDVADWLGVKDSCLFNFSHSERPVPISINIDGFSEKAYCPRMATMNKPAYAVIRQYSDKHPVLIFVSSRRQTRLTALDLISFSSEMHITSKQFLRASEEEIQAIISKIDDEHLRHTLLYGIGMHHAGLTENDRKIVEDLFVNQRIQVLVTTSTLAWGVNFPARLVIVKGTEFYDHKVKHYVDFPMTDLLQMIGRAGRPQFDDQGVACIFVQEEKKDFYQKFLYDPFPVESLLHTHLHDHINAEISGGTISSLQDCINYLSSTYFYTRLIKNPKYYGVQSSKTADEVNAFLGKMSETVLNDLLTAGCIKVDEKHAIEATELGYISSYYYLSYKTVQLFEGKMYPLLNKRNAIFHLIELITEATEFDGLPVRHNEEILNAYMAQKIPLKLENPNFSDPHYKAALLLLGYFLDIPFPITDFITDSKSILDQSVRVVQGMIEIAKKKNYLDTLLALINILQMIVQGLWINDSPLLQLNRNALNVEDILELRKHNIVVLPELMNTRLPKSIPKKKQEVINKELARFPVVQSHVKLYKGSSGEKDSTKLTEDEIMLTLHVQKHWGEHQLTTRFGKIKEPAWYFIVGNEDTNTIVKCMRFSLHKEIKQRVTFNWPESQASAKLKAYIMSDSYMSLDHVIQLSRSSAIEYSTSSISSFQVAEA